MNKPIPDNFRLDHNFDNFFYLITGVRLSRYGCRKMFKTFFLFLQDFDVKYVLSETKICLRCRQFGSTKCTLCGRERIVHFTFTIDESHENLEKFRECLKFIKSLPTNRIEIIWFVCDMKGILEKLDKFPELMEYISRNIDPGIQLLDGTNYDSIEEGVMRAVNDYALQVGPFHKPLKLLEAIVKLCKMIDKIKEIKSVFSMFSEEKQTAFLEPFLSPFLGEEGVYYLFFSKHEFAKDWLQTYTGYCKGGILHLMP